MAVQSVRGILCLVIMAAVYIPIDTQPMFGRFYCDLFCDDYDYDVAASSTSFEDLLDAVFGDPCTDCPTRAPSTTTTTANPMQQMPFNFMFPPVGMNMTMGRNNNGWFMNFWPFSSGGTSAPSSPASPASAATPAVGPTTRPANATNSTTG